MYYLVNHVVEIGFKDGLSGNLRIVCLKHSEQAPN
ncbi:hypothetical protein N475_10070 [Pseudoalteromonas luteoviolacea DSM 6061]|uniref:Uncharacterized protein n=1 Tax=Pseudoalteromonas luteoviolacea DSM 6061 TaxID=1365250 RepID=A0A162A2G9_9GAMM|nr:hypothetical protein N475_10070 [Pseudoalteromonas luteoviolacea DSM 6061]